MSFEKMPEQKIKSAEKEMVKQMPKAEDYKKDGNDEGGKTKMKIDAPPPAAEKALAKGLTPEKVDLKKEPIKSARKVNLTK